MSTAKQSGIWMDHSSAHLIEFITGPIESEIITCKFTHQDKQQKLAFGEKGMHQKEQHFLTEYYKKIGESILKYNEVILFGTTNAKSELYNILKDDHRFSKITITTEQTDKLTEKQQLAFVREYYSKE